MDSSHIQTLIDLATSDEGLATAQRIAKEAWPAFPNKGCAVNLSALLQLSGIDVPMTKGAGKLAYRLKLRGWIEVNVGQQLPGDVGVTFDNNDIPGADHVYLVVQVVDHDEMIIADNQARTVHQRFASGRNKTPTDYFLRAV